jgi:outer membrane protein assembly factor BamE
MVMQTYLHNPFFTNNCRLPYPSSLTQLTPYIHMRLLPLSSDRMRATIGGVSLVLATCLAGCASKNPLIDDPHYVRNASAGKSVAYTNSGVQTTKENRFLGIFSPYRVDIQQGNFVSREMLAQLKEAMKKGDMTPDQVRFVMGTPLLTDIFHQDRWDYVFRLKKNNGEIIESITTLYFKNNRLVNVVGGDLPTEKDYLSLIAGQGASSSNTNVTPSTK